MCGCRCFLQLLFHALRSSPGLSLCIYFVPSFLRVFFLGLCLYVCVVVIPSLVDVGRSSFRSSCIPPGIPLFLLLSSSFSMVLVRDSFRSLLPYFIHFFMCKSFDISFFSVLFVSL